MRNQRRLRIKGSCMLGAQRIIGVQIPMIECAQHLPQPLVGTPLQRLYLEPTNVTKVSR